jgi:uncharacterized protein (TIGR02600 family)
MNPLSLRSRIASHRAVALLLVLGALVLISIVVVGFLTAVRQDRTSTGYYEAGTRSRQFADTAVGIVTAQIAEATASPDHAWISQPGLLRTFQPAGAVAAYKLYSSDNMKVEGAYDPGTATATEVPANWSDRLDEFVDLNRPVQVGLDLVYPISDPSARSSEPDGVEGFSIASTAPVVASGAAANALPMPVKWIYVLKDGSLATHAQATASSSPAVARIGFWTDDETCKVNVNTASDGVFYDSPAANTQEDHNLGKFQPIAQEYQRYPGHPATTSLASVIKELRDESSPVERSRLASLISPRIGWGGSKGGSDTAWWNRNVGETDSDRLYASLGELAFTRSGTSWNGTDGTRPTPTLPANASTWSKHLAKFPFFLTTDSRAPELNLLNRPRITLWPFNKELVDGDSEMTPLLTPEDRLIKFASELGGPPSLTGQPRRKLYFQRQNAWDPFNDYAAIQDNQDIYSYLQYMTSQPFPSASASRAGTNTFAGKFSHLGRDQIITMMFDYLRSGVNTINYSYEPVGGPTYSFPQGHQPEMSGFNDVTPLVINAGNGDTKGLGKGLALNEFVLQFYVIKEELVDQNDNVVTVASGQGKYKIRHVQLVALADFAVTLADLTSAMPRFQMQITGAPFEIDTALSPDLRVRMSGTSPWAAGSTGIGFPDPNGSINLVCNVGAEEDYSSNVSVKGGFLGVSYGLFCASSDNPKTYMDAGANSLGKTLARASGFPGYSVYPFVSEVMQFRIPCDPAGVIAGDPAGTYITVKPTPVSISLHPALVPGATSHANVQQPNSANYFQKIDLALGEFQMPLPRVRNGTVTESWDAWKWKDGIVKTGEEFGNYANRFQSNYRNFILQTGKTDVLRSYHLATASGPGGDLRLAAARRDIPSSWYVPSLGWGTSATEREVFQGTPLVAYSDGQKDGLLENIGLRAGVYSNAGWDLRSKTAPLVLNAPTYNEQSYPRAGALSMDSTRRSGSTVGDFTAGFGLFSDGALVKGPDIGGVSPSLTETPYYSVLQFSRGGASDNASSGGSGMHVNFTGLLLSPWKQMPSPVAFGTLPSRALDPAGSPWETLLFNPYPAGGKATHRGWTNLPRDHYWLDLFYMPVVEPYAITENFATNGKINLNQQIAPFTYIHRTTGLHALLRNLKIMAVPTNETSNYKSIGRTIANATNAQYRYPLDVAATVANIEARWASPTNDPFVSASEICEIPLVPTGVSNLDNFWSSRELTSDDKREMPYNSLYPRVTTRSNTYTVYFCAQTLQGKPGKWQVTGQYRGSETIERYLDLATRAYGETGSSANAMFPALSGRDADGEPYYRFRTLSHHQFSP